MCALNLDRENKSSISVNVLNGATKAFDTSQVEFNIINMTRSKKTRVSTYTATNITSDLEAVDWTRYKRKFSHLAHIPFPRPAKKTVDLIIGLDCAELHHVIKEIPGNIGEPIARLTPLGWTCVGSTDVR